MSPWRLREISRQIQRGAIIAYPTDTIWGFGCNPLSLTAVNRLQRLKQRSPDKGLILLSSSADYLKPYIDEDDFSQLPCQTSTQDGRPVTWIVRASPFCPRWLTGQRETLAIRISHIPQIGLLCDPMQIPLVSTSANISGRTPVRNTLLTHKHFRQAVDYIIDGFNAGGNRASRIIDLKTGQILRD